MFSYTSIIIDYNRLATPFMSLFTDSKFVIDNLDIGGYPKLEYYYQLINDMNNLANLLNDYNVHINIIKISSHIGIQGNHHADALAKAAATIAFNCKCNFDDTIRYNTFKNPINVDISKDIIYLNKLYKKEKRKMATTTKQLE